MAAGEGGVVATRIAVVSASIGEGHDGVARGLARRLRTAGFTVNVHDFVDLWPAGRPLRTAYARQLQVAPRSWGWLLKALARFRPFSALVVGWAAVGAARGLRRAL